MKLKDRLSNLRSKIRSIKESKAFPIEIKFLIDIIQDLWILFATLVLFLQVSTDCDFPLWVKIIQIILGIFLFFNYRLKMKTGEHPTMKAELGESKLTPSEENED